MNILLAIDESQCSSEAVASVAARPWPPETNVRVLSAVTRFPPHATEIWYDTTGDLKRLQQELTDQAEELTKSVAETLNACSLRAEPIVRNGDPSFVIVEEAKEWPADLIVVGSHGYTGVKRWLIGSVAQSVVSHAPCSVEVVRQKSNPTVSPTPQPIEINEDRRAF